MRTESTAEVTAATAGTCLAPSEVAGLGETWSIGGGGSWARSCRGGWRSGATVLAGQDANLQWPYRGRDRRAEIAPPLRGRRARQSRRADVRRPRGRSAGGERRGPALRTLRPVARCSMEQPTTHHRRAAPCLPRIVSRGPGRRNPPPAPETRTRARRRPIRYTQRQRPGDGRSSFHLPRSNRARLPRHSGIHNFIHLSLFTSVRGLSDGYREWTGGGCECARQE